MKDRGIVLSQDEVKAAKAGELRQLWRVMKPQPMLQPAVMRTPMDRRIDTACWHWLDEWWWQDPQQSTLDKCPYGKPGDSLWGKETWATIGSAAEIKPSELTSAYGDVVVYRADTKMTCYYDWRSAIYMPRCIARIWLDIADIKVKQRDNLWYWGIAIENIVVGTPAKRYLTNNQP